MSEKAKVGDRIEFGRPVPPNVAAMIDLQAIAERHSDNQWVRTSVDPALFDYQWPDGPVSEGITVERLREHRDWWPMEVTAIDPEPDPGPEPRVDVAEAVRHLGIAIGVLRSARRRITGDYVKPERNLDPLGPLDDGISRVKDAKALLTGVPIEPPQEPRVWGRLVEEETTKLPFRVQVKDPAGAVTMWRRLAFSRDYQHDGRSMRLEQLRYLGEVTEVIEP